MVPPSSQCPAGPQGHRRWAGVRCEDGGHRGQIPSGATPTARRQPPMRAGRLAIAARCTHAAIARHDRCAAESMLRQQSARERNEILTWRQDLFTQSVKQRLRRSQIALGPDLVKESTHTGLFVFSQHSRVSHNDASSSSQRRSVGSSPRPWNSTSITIIVADPAWASRHVRSCRTISESRR